MSSKYWNELSNEEKNKLQKEWYSSHWFQQSKKESMEIDETPSNVFRVIGIVFLCIICIYGILLLISYPSNNPDLIDGVEKMFFLIPLCALITFPSLIISALLRTIVGNKRVKYIEEEEKKWLLKNYNIIK